MVLTVKRTKHRLLILQFHGWLFAGAGRLKFDAFCRVVVRFTAEEEDDEVMLLELKEAFRLYDKEGNGYIPVDSLREILLALDDQLTDDQLNEMIEEIDSDSSGTVDFDGEECLSVCVEGN